MKTLLHMEMYYVIEYTPTWECILHYIGTDSEKVAEVQK